MTHWEVEDAPATAVEVEEEGRKTDPQTIEPFVKGRKSSVITGSNHGTSSHTACVEMIECSVRAILQELLQLDPLDSDESWRSVHLADPSLKFKVIPPF